ncbi:MAG: MFS transporter, partial [Paracoccaceae bacterium]
MSDLLTRAPGDTAPVSICAPEARKWVLLTAILASSLGFIDGSVVAIALPAMRASLGASLAEAQWFANAYLLVLSAFILAGGALGDRFGTARVFGAGIGIFVLGSVLCAVAPTPETLIAARAVKGLGAALMVPGSMAIIGKAYPREMRGRAIGTWSAASAITTALGPIIGGAVLTLGPDWAWRLIFAVNLPLGGIALWLLFTRVVPDRGQPGVPIDLLGAVLATVGLGLI